jgi:biopolymer transport protein ExbD
VGNPRAFPWRPSRAMAIRAEKRCALFYSRIDVSALLSVSLVLLIEFMLNAPRSTLGMGVDLPHARHSLQQPGARREDTIRVSVIRDGKTYFNASRVEPSEIAGMIYGAMLAGAENKVYLVVDSRAKNGDVEPVIDQIQSAGITRVAILTAKGRD